MANTDIRVGAVKIDRSIYFLDSEIRLLGTRFNAAKKLPKIQGTSHTISEEEIRYVYNEGCKHMVVGVLQAG